VGFSSPQVSYDEDIVCPKSWSACKSTSVLRFPVKGLKPLQFAPRIVNRDIPLLTRKISSLEAG
jgi:hypothetical protein